MKWLSLAFVCALVWSACAIRAADEAKTGAYHTTFTDRSPLSSIETQAKRFGWSMTAWKASEYEKDYDLGAESFEVNVPESYKAGDGWGLFVWVSAGGGGGLHGDWREVLERHKLIWIGPNKVGNERAVWCRMGLAIDAVHNLKKRYDISPSRIYISGASGGGRVSSMLGVCYPDIFKGGMYIIGCNYYREMAAPNAGGQVWHRGYAPPPGEILIQAKKNVSHVLLTGERDPNREQTQVYYEKGFKKDGFLHVTYLEVPGMGHQPPNSEWFEKGLLAMEEMKPAGAVAATLPASSAVAVANSGDDSAANGALKAARELAGKDVVAGYGAFLEVARKYSKSGVAKTALEEADKLMENAENRKRIESAAEADKLLRVARVYAENKLWREARSRLEKILADFPDAPAAKEAKELLRQIGPG